MVIITNFQRIVSDGWRAFCFIVSVVIIWRRQVVKLKVGSGEWEDGMMLAWQCVAVSSDLLPRQMSRKGDAAVTLAAAQKWNGATAGTRTAPFRFLLC